MKKRKRAKKSVKAKKPAKFSRSIRKIQAAAETARRPRYKLEDLSGWYRPVKKPVTVRLDADILAWFKKGGRGYQTRINRALRRIMAEEQKRRA
jgi:uncharacterized protein (DUF4415 family)